MKKLLVILAVMMMVPMASFAQLAVGGAAFLKAPVLIGQPVDLGNMNVNQFSFGGDARLKISLFQLQSLMLFSAGDVSSLDIFLDAGVAVDVAMVRLSAGAGPNFVWNFDCTPPLQAGLNAKIGADVLIDNMSLGISYVMAMYYNNRVDINTGTGLLGVQVLFWM